ncbi:MAG: hypothetical protein WD604_10405 [Balneolaceae bacterium]
MIAVEISGDERRENDEITVEWLNKALNARGLDTNQICVIISINHANVKLNLLTGACASKSGQSISKFPIEAQQIIQLWIDHRLNQEMFPFGKLVSFLKKLFNHFDLQLK